MTRSLYKPDFISKDILRKLNNSNFLEPIKTRSRNTTITNEMMGKAFAIHNGKLYPTVTISHPDMIGHKLGEFSFTKRMGSFLHKEAHATRVRKKKQKTLAQKKSKTKTKAKKK